jgi:hypothetical protein
MTDHHLDPSGHGTTDRDFRATGVRAGVSPLFVTAALFLLGMLAFALAEIVANL